MSQNAEAFERAGVCDPRASEAAGRLGFLRYLVERGLTLDEIASADLQDLL